MNDLWLSIIALAASTVRVVTPLILAALLFGALYQGGSEIAFDIPAITKDMVVVIQGLVILFCGALENMFKPQIAALFRPRRLVEAA